jgi:hypothetical protein
VTGIKSKTFLHDRKLVGSKFFKSEGSGQSIGIASFKLIGTFAPTLIYGLKSNFVLFLRLSCFIADLIYLLLLIGLSKKIASGQMV